ncbi:MAG: response regulator [Chloroflexi bacterium]|nr:response regulator [Chloroflexota bacterium]MBI4506973.1 response regulator [Chloroflexota bacterium]
MATVLIIHQDPLALEHLADMLGDEGYKTVGAHSVREAVALLTKQRVELIVLDAESVAKSAQGHLNFGGLAPVLQAAEDVPVILSTDWLREDVQEKAEERFADIVWKPVEPSDLLTSARSLVPPR